MTGVKNHDGHVKTVLVPFHWQTSAMHLNCSDTNVAIRSLIGSGKPSVPKLQNRRISGSRKGQI